MARPTRARPPRQTPGRTRATDSRLMEVPVGGLGTAEASPRPGDRAPDSGQRQRCRSAEVSVQCWVCVKGQCQTCDRDRGLVPLETTKARDVQVLPGRPFPGLGARAGKRGSLRSLSPGGHSAPAEALSTAELPRACDFDNGFSAGKTAAVTEGLVVTLRDCSLSLGGALSCVLCGGPSVSHSGRDRYTYV